MLPKCGKMLIQLTSCIAPYRFCCSDCKANLSGEAAHLVFYDEAAANGTIPIKLRKKKHHNRLTLVKYLPEEVVQT